MGFLSKLLSFGEGKQLKGYEEQAARINALEPAMQALSDEELRALTARFRERSERGESLDALLPEAFAAAREASVRTTGLRHFDVQLIGGMALNAGQIAEMKTGEGKTLVSTLAGYLNAIPGHNVHIVTVNDYLARRDSEWMGRIYRFLGMEVGLLQNGMRPEARVPAYKADVTYGTNSEFGFDYLRDNMVTRPGSRVQRGHAFAIVDEVDSILIDEARTPLIISGLGGTPAATYVQFANIMPLLKPDEDFVLDETKRTIYATEEGLDRIEAMLGTEIYNDLTGQLANHLKQALRAQFLFKKDVEYVVLDGEVKIVDEFTGRIMEGRRWSEGLHQAVEAKERVPIKEENQTLATITLQNYFRLYDKLSGMTGTAMTEDAEFRQIYKLPVFAIPPNRPVIRRDENDLVYRTVDAKFNAVADDIAARNATGQPCLVGTVSIESSERLSRLLDKRGIAHETLNAKNHEREAHIVAQAGRVGAVTIATNMAGRGTDILLGGNPEILAEDFLRARGLDPDAPATDAEGAPNPDAPTEAQRAETRAEADQLCAAEQQQVRSAGGLCVIGTERHESRRIDNQLRGRAGRQGDPGVTQFYLSLEDDLMRLFGGNKMESISNMMLKTNMPDDQPIQAGMVSKSIESAQRQVESMHFAARKNVLEYDDVMNLQRQAIYEERNAILDGKDMAARIPEIVADSVAAMLAEATEGADSSEDWDLKAIDLWVMKMTGRPGFSAEEVGFDDDPEVLQEAIEAYLNGIYEEKAARLGDEVMRNLAAQVMLRIIDTRWMAHLQEMDYLKTGIGQRDPLVEYKNEAFSAFERLTASMYDDYLNTILRLEIAIQKPEEINEQASLESRRVNYSSPEEALSQSALKGAAGPGAAPAGGAPKPAPTKPQTFEKDRRTPTPTWAATTRAPAGRA